MSKITEMTKARFCELVQAIDDGSLEERWPEGKEPETEAEHVEVRQIIAISMLSKQKSIPDLIHLDWKRLEVWTRTNGPGVKIDLIGVRQ